MRFQGQQWAKDRTRLAATGFPRDVREGLMQFTPSPFLVWFLLHPSLLPVAALPWPGLSWSDRAHRLLGSLPGEGQALAPSQFKSEFTLKALKKLRVDPLPSLRHPEES